MTTEQKIAVLTTALQNLQRRIDELEISLEQGARAAALDDQFHFEAMQRRQDECEMMASF